MPDLYSDSMLLTEARARVAKLLPLLEGPDQQALDVLIGRLDRLESVADIARKVRVAQNRYFADRTTEALHTSKDLERKLDAMLKE